MPVSTFDSYGDIPKQDGPCEPSPSPFGFLTVILQILLWPLYFLGLFWGPLLLFPY